MPQPDFHKELAALTKKFGKPNFVIYGFDAGDGEFEMNFAVHKVPLKTVIQGLLHVLNSIVDQTIK